MKRFLQFLRYYLLYTLLLYALFFLGGSVLSGFESRIDYNATIGYRIGAISGRLLYPGILFVIIGIRQKAFLWIIFWLAGVLGMLCAYYFTPLVGLIPLALITVFPAKDSSS